MSKTELPHLNSYQVHPYRSQKGQKSLSHIFGFFHFLIPYHPTHPKNVTSTFQIDPEFHHLYFKKLLPKEKEHIGNH